MGTSGIKGFGDRFGEQKQGERWKHNAGSHHGAGEGLRVLDCIRMCCSVLGCVEACLGFAVCCVVPLL